jgi:hypothetical protein
MPVRGDAGASDRLLGGPERACLSSQAAKSRLRREIAVKPSVADARRVGRGLRRTDPMAHDKRYGALALVGIPLRLIEFTIETRTGQELYRLLCSILDHRKAPAIQLTHLYHRRGPSRPSLPSSKPRFGAEGSSFAARLRSHPSGDLRTADGPLRRGCFHAGGGSYPEHRALRPLVPPRPARGASLPASVCSFPPSIPLVDLSQRFTPIPSPATHLHPSSLS